MAPAAHPHSRLMAAPLCPIGNSLLSKSARGDLDALRDLIAYMTANGAAGVVTRQQWLWSVEPIARMAASHGHPRDRYALAGIIFEMAKLEAETGGADVVEFQGEALSIINGLADEGDEHATAWLEALTPTVAADAVQFAKTVDAIGEDAAEGDA